MSGRVLYKNRLCVCRHYHLIPRLSPCMCETLCKGQTMFVHARGERLHGKVEVINGAENVLLLMEYNQ